MSLFCKYQHKTNLENWNHANEGFSYTKEEENLLWKLWMDGEHWQVIASQLERSVFGVVSKKYHILEEYGKDVKGELRVKGKRHDHVILKKKRNGKWWDQLGIQSQKVKITATREKEVFYYRLKRDGTKAAYRVAQLIGRSQQSVLAKMEEKGPCTNLFDIDTSKKKKHICPKCRYEF